VRAFGRASRIGARGVGCGRSYGRWLREAGVNPARTRHCDRGCPPRRAIARAATGPPPAGREGAERGSPGSQETCLRPSHPALAERGWLMLASSRTATAAVICLALALLASASAALAAGPA